MICHASEAARFGLREADIGVDLRARRKCLSATRIRQVGHERARYSARAGAAPIVFITAHADKSVQPRLLERGAVACPSSRSAMSPLRAAVGIEVLADVLELAELRSEILRVRGPAESEPGTGRPRYN